MSAVWFSGWTTSPVHKIFYQSANSFGAAAVCIAALESTGVDGSPRRWSALLITIAVTFSTALFLHSHLWKRHMPFITAEQATLLSSTRASPAPIVARVWLIGAMCLTFLCVFAITFDLWFEGPIWRLRNMPGSCWGFSILSPIVLSFQKPFNRLPAAD